MKNHMLIYSVAFGIMAVFALGAAIFKGATHQLIIFGICSVMSAISFAQNREDEKEERGSR